MGEKIRNEASHVVGICGLTKAWVKERGEEIGGMACERSEVQRSYDPSVSPRSQRRPGVTYFVIARERVSECTPMYTLSTHFEVSKDTVELRAV